jgi:hypothetical protein
MKAQDEQRINVVRMNGRMWRSNKSASTNRQAGMNNIINNKAPENRTVVPHQVAGRCRHVEWYHRCRTKQAVEIPSM